MLACSAARPRDSFTRKVHSPGPSPPLPRPPPFIWPDPWTRPAPAPPPFPPPEASSPAPPPFPPPGFFTTFAPPPSSPSDAGFPTPPPFPPPFPPPPPTPVSPAIVEGVAAGLETGGAPAGAAEAQTTEGVASQLGTPMILMASAILVLVAGILAVLLGKNFANTGRMAFRKSGSRERYPMSSMDAASSSSAPPVGEPSTTSRV